MAVTDLSNGSHRNNWHRNSSPQTRVWLGKIGKNRRGLVHRQFGDEWVASRRFLMNALPMD
ncbi:hypothetical protein RBWH47_02197 [Rhodopirellula baltica WH47]|uniref:Uncharacterized protein n=1 Tax=Rhodopirellula baltica WH47 TaxID=991778 RepID=F2AWG7_RHOBT|nr:hypothetical protein RBWH47_02197 [Rhodopirellula baltica WH47]